MGKFALGQSVPRTEDPRLLTGRGRYTDDFVLPRMSYGYVLRSPHAHATIRGIDTRAAQQMPGVLAVLTGADWAAEKFGTLGPVLPRKRRDGSPMYIPPRPALAHGRAMLVGDPVAFVVAETLDLAKDAAERIAVDYAPLPSLTATDKAKAPDAPKLWPSCPDNEFFFLYARGQGGGRCRFRARTPRHAVEGRLQSYHRGDDGAARLSRRL